MIRKGNFFYVLNSLISGTVSLILYFLAIEANRKASKEHIMVMINESKKNYNTEINVRHESSIEDPKNGKNSLLSQ
jgi:hypothetical protein